MLKIGGTADGGGGTKAELGRFGRNSFGTRLGIGASPLGERSHASQ